MRVQSELHRQCCQLSKLAPLSPGQVENLGKLNLQGSGLQVPHLRQLLQRIAITLWVQDHAAGSDVACTGPVRVLDH